MVRVGLASFPLPSHARGQIRYERPRTGATERASERAPNYQLGGGGGGGGGGKEGKESPPWLAGAVPKRDELV